MAGSYIDRKIGRNLRKIRLEKKMMQIDVAVATNKNRTYISRIETGKARTTMNLVIELCRGLEIDPVDLMGNTFVGRFFSAVMKEKEQKNV